MSDPLRINESVVIPGSELHWRLPPSPDDGRVDPTLGGFVFRLGVNLETTTALSPEQRKLALLRIDVRYTGGEATVTVPGHIPHLEAQPAAREAMATLLRDAITPLPHQGRQPAHRDDGKRLQAKRRRSTVKRSRRDPENGVG
jgi:ribosome-associated protein